MKNIKLPEKDWFTFAEVAKRWNVDVETVAHYVWDLCLLRPAFIIDRITYAAWSAFDANIPSTYFFPDDNYNEQPPFGVATGFYNPDGSMYEGRFYYLKYIPEDIPLASIQQAAKFRWQAYMTPVDIDGSVLRDVSPIHDLGQNLLTDFAGTPLNYSSSLVLKTPPLREPCVLVMPICNDYFITREERDRFEAVHSEDEVKAAGKTREENTLYALGVMAMLLAEQGPKYTHRGRPNAEQIANAVNEAAVRLKLPDKALKALHKKIKPALDLVNDLSKPDKSG